MRFEELPEIKDGDKLSLELLLINNQSLLAQLKTCSSGGLFYARQVTMLSYDKFRALTQQFGTDQTLEMHVLEVYKPVNLLVTAVMTRFSTMYIPLEMISSVTPIFSS